MIHNITEEREKRNNRDDFFSNALTDEELLRLIGQVEERELIRAPRHLKEEVFRKIDRQSRQERNRRFFSYRVKVLAGMAAALMVLLLLPIEGQNALESPRVSFVNQLLREGTVPVEDEWEQTILAEEQEIDRKWERYQKKQERKEAGERYLQEVKEYFTNHFVWED